MEENSDLAFFCEKCGARLHQGQRFCTKCGAPIQGRPSQGQPEILKKGFRILAKTIHLPPRSPLESRSPKRIFGDMIKRLGQWLLGIGIGSQLLPALGIGVPLRAIVGSGQATVGVLTSLIGGLLYGLATAKRQPAPARAALPSFQPAARPIPRPQPTPPSPRDKPAARQPVPLKVRTRPAAAKTQFSVVLVSAGPAKIQVIREVRALTASSLTEAVDIVEGAPRTIRKSLSRKKASEIKARLEALGAKVELQ